MVSPRKDCFRRGCLIPAGFVLSAYALWSLWTGWLGPDRIETWGASFPGQIIAHCVTLAEHRQALDRDTEAFVELLNRPIPRSLQRPAVGSEDEEVAAGLRLPREYDPRLREQYYDDMEDFLVGDYLVRNAVEHHFQWRYRFVSDELWERQSPSLVQWLAKQADILPPRRLDTFIIMNTHWGTRPNEEFWRTTTDAWRRMASGRNPYYRLLALRSVSHWAKDWEEQRAVYVRALDERSDVFLDTVLYAIAYNNITDPELIAAVERVAREHPPGHDHTGNEDTKVLAERVLRKMQALGEKTAGSE